MFSTFTEKNLRGQLKAEDCRNMKDVIRVVFDVVDMSGNDQVLEKDNVVVRWVWPGPEFSDRVVKITERAAIHACDARLLKEIRLVATKVSSAGVKILEKVFPNATITLVSKEEDINNWRWSQAVYEGK